MTPERPPRKPRKRLISGEELAELRAYNNEKSRLEWIDYYLGERNKAIERINHDRARGFRPPNASAERRLAKIDARLAEYGVYLDDD